MWNSRKSVTLSMTVLAVFSALLVGMVLFAPPILNWFISVTDKDQNRVALIAIFYCCAAPAGLAIILLFRLLFNIRKEKIFVVENTNLLRYISWCCFVVVPITFWGGFYYFSLFLISVAAAFMGLILRVIKNIMTAATELKNENELTI